MCDLLKHTVSTEQGRIKENPGYQTLGDTNIKLLTVKHFSLSKFSQYLLCFIYQNSVFVYWNTKNNWDKFLVDILDTILSCEV